MTEAEKIIFLDIDGVITSEPYTRQCIFEHRRENLYGLDWFDPHCLDALRKVVNETEAKIIVSSSWRDIGIQKLQKVWESNNMPGELLGITPPEIVSKERAIRQWLDDNPCTRFVVLDDEFMDIQRLIKTKPSTGLSDKDADRCIELLNKD